MRSEEGNPLIFPSNPDPFPAKCSFPAPGRERGACLWVETSNQLELGKARKERECESLGLGTGWPFL